MKLGDVVETAIWLNGEETPEQRRKYEADVRGHIAELCSIRGFMHGPVTFTEKKPGDHRVPPVPRHIHGIDVKLLVAESPVVGLAPVIEHRSFINDLDPKDLQRLRATTRRIHHKYRPHVRLSNAECDDIIDAIGLDAAMETLRAETVH